MKHIFILFLLFSTALFSQNNNETCVLFSKINDLLIKEHFQPKPVDDSLSVYVFDGLLNILDNNRNLFSKIEYEKLSKHRLNLDNYIADKNCDFMDDFVSNYKVALERKKTVLEKIQFEEFDYNAKDSVRFSKKSFPFEMVENDLERIWKKRFRFDILEDISKMSFNLDSLSVHFIKLERTTKSKIFDSSLCQLSSLLESKKGIDNDLQSHLLNLFCTYFDPHSNYFSVDAKSSFMSGFSTSNLSLGLNVGLTENEEIIIQEIIPGGPAAKTEQFEKDDIITKVSNKKGEEFTVTCASLDKIGELIFSDSNKEIEITVRKKTGNTIAVLLKKQVMKATSNLVYSYLAENESKVGYINIPNFYSNFDGNGIQGCADDVAKEIAKLQKDDIEGLVIDLQGNGGGSMDEAIKLAGMFVDIGPISVLVDHKNKQTILKDSNRGLSYSGPIVILIDQESASASEFFSAAMQDYNRAVLIGNTSLGKATMQVILPVDDKNEQDFVKLTMQKFYRITGESNQIKGVIPDVLLPVLFDNIKPNEKSFKTALKYDTIITKARFNPLPKNDILEVINSSYSRLKSNLTFKEMTALNDQINAVYNFQRKPVRLTFKDIFKDIHNQDELFKKIKKIANQETSCKISNNSYDVEKLKFDIYEQDVNAFRIRDVKANPYLEEAVAIIKDFNNLKK